MHPGQEQIESQWSERGRSKIASGAQAARPAELGNWKVLQQPKKEQIDLPRGFL